jgi:signal transduction histidine kinase
LNIKWTKSSSSSGSNPSSRRLSSHSISGSTLSSIIAVLKSPTFIYYTLLPAILLTIISILSLDLHAWHLSEIHHFYIELFAVILGSILAFYYIVRAHTLKDNFSRFVGFGFLVSALIDLLHVLVTFAFIDNMSFLKYFIPQTWFAGRIVLSAMLVMAIAKYSEFAGEGRDKTERFSTEEISSDKRKMDSEYEENGDRIYEARDKKGLSLASYSSNKTFIISLAFLSVLAGAVSISSLYFILPYSVIDNFPIHRPYEIPPLIMFIIALVLFYKNQLYKKTDVFYKGILAYLIIDIYSQIIMSYSANSFDTAHMVAHVLKDAGYFVNIIALALSSIQYSLSLRESNKSLIESYIKLREKEQELSTQYGKLKESEKMKDEFINTAAHELRTPIQPIIGLTDTIRFQIISLYGKDRYNEHESQPDVNIKLSEQKILTFLGVITRNAKRLKLLADNILDVTKIESHSLKLNKEQFDIRKLIQDTVEEEITNIRDIIETRIRIEIVYMIDGKEIDHTTCTIKDSFSEIYLHVVENVNNNARLNPSTVTESFLVEADSTKISQVMCNLLSNAFRAIRSKNKLKEGILVILIKKNNKMQKERVELNKITLNNNHIHNLGRVAEIIVSIHDNGDGISPKILPNIFGKFVSGTSLGTGLGLYISKNIIEAHGGRMWVSNNDSEIGTAKPDGATFCFSLPMLQTDSALAKRI